MPSLYYDCAPHDDIASDNEYAVFCHRLEADIAQSHEKPDIDRYEYWERAVDKGVHDGVCRPNQREDFLYRAEILRLADREEWLKRMLQFYQHLLTTDERGLAVAQHENRFANSSPRACEYLQWDTKSQCAACTNGSSGCAKNCSTKPKEPELTQLPSALAA